MLFQKFRLCVLMALALGVAICSAASVMSAATPHIEFISGKFDARLRYVNDSGVCETTPGVHSASGYIDIAKNQSLWFWFFAARENPDTAPFTLWLNGGPGCSSMIGLFQENGPCLVNPDRATTTLNPYRHVNHFVPQPWNNISNMIYIDQPVGAGFSFGVETVNSSQAAAPPVWTAFQLFFENPEFSKYKSREFIFASESYGGHYGPAFVTYFDEQNAKIDAGMLEAEKVTVSAMMINNGWFDPLIQSRAYIDFAADAPGYGPLVPKSVIEKMNNSWFSENGCLAQAQACYDAGNGTRSDEICEKADDTCFQQTFIPAVGDRDPDDLRQNSESSAPFPPRYYFNFLQRADIKAKIGATSDYGECPDAPYNLFLKTGDDARSWLPQLSRLVDSKLRVLIWAGDADINCNWVGGHAAVMAMDWYGKERLANTPLTNITICQTPIASVQNVDNFSFARVYGAGHEVPAFQPPAAFEIFKQVVALEQLHSV